MSPRAELGIGESPVLSKSSGIFEGFVLARYVEARLWKFEVIFWSPPSMPLIIDRRPSAGMFAMMVSVIILTCAAFADGLSSIVLEAPILEACGVECVLTLEVFRDARLFWHIRRYCPRSQTATRKRNSSLIFSGCIEPL